MDHLAAKEFNDLLFSFMGLFHEKFLIPYRQYEDDLPALKKNHVKILSMLYQHDILTSTEISRRLDIEKGSLTSLVDCLEKKGLVLRNEDPGDRRKLNISLSEAGREAMNRLLEQHSVVLRHLLRDMDAKDIERYTDCLRYAVTFMGKL